MCSVADVWKLIQSWCSCLETRSTPKVEAVVTQINGSTITRPPELLSPRRRFVISVRPGEYACICDTRIL